MASCTMERGTAAVQPARSLGADVRSAVQEELAGTRVAHVGGDVERRLAGAALHVDLTKHTAAWDPTFPRNFQRLFLGRTDGWIDR